MKSSIRVAIVGVGNCAKSLVEGTAIYACTQSSRGLAFPAIGGYTANHIRFVLAYDIDPRKVGRSLADAIKARPNCAIDLGASDEAINAIGGNVRVKRGALLDGVALHMLLAPEDESFRVSDDLDPSAADVVADLRRHEVDILLNYLPVGSEEATRFYVEACIEARVPFVNCIPVFIVSDPQWEKRLIEAGIPAIGDDMRSQLGASVLSQALQELFFDRGMDVNFHAQTNQGGNTDFLNMTDRTRLRSKKISKENVIRSQSEIRGIPVKRNSIHAGPSDYIPHYGDNKVAHLRIEAQGFGGAIVTLDARLSVQDSPNSAGVAIDALRYLQVARELGLVGSLRGPSAATQKTPMAQMKIQDAYEECKALAERQLTETVKRCNLPRC